MPEEIPVEPEEPEEPEDPPNKPLSQPRRPPELSDPELELAGAGAELEVEVVDVELSDEDPSKRLSSELRNPPSLLPGEAA